MSLVRRMSSRDAAQVPSPTTVEGFGAGAAAPASRSLGSPAFAHHASFGEHITESPVMQTGPSFQDSRYPAGHTSRLTSPVPLPMSPALTAEAACDVDATHKAGPDVLTKTGESSPPVLPPSSPPPGTVNPMDIMAPSNPSEQVWRTDQELYYMAHPEASPHSPPSLPSPTSPPLPSSPHSRPHELTSPPSAARCSSVPQHINPPHSPQQPDIPQYNSPAPPIYPPGVPQYNSPAPPIHPPDVPQYNNRPHSHHLPDGPQYINPPHSHHPLDVPQYINPPPPIPEEEIPMPATVKQEPESQGPAPIAAFPTYPVYHSMVQPSAHHAYSQLMPSIYGHAPSSDDHWTEVSDYSTPMPSQGSMLSAHATPHTQLSETSPSAISEPSYADIRNSTSPYNGVSGSPGRHTCGHCGRTFDQAHKLNHHRRYHERPHKCTHEGCNKQFGTKTHLERHINDKHNKLRKYHCLEPSCPYSKVGGKAFPRKDNWRRHMINKHGMSPSADPEPDLADDAKM
ncbi:hypothetical protein ACRALDRAFT_1061121, partial [Sodiomyces alcalophilus JCM 7366]|uniref:uncharacterized protein n=1 Tax=Sodiomyces alcalophilus JCM 7366 TaxID=591952 RepID=UPI0039B371C0